MQLLELRDHVYDLIQDHDEDVFSSTQVDRWLNRSARYLIRIIRDHAPEEFTKTDTFTTTNGTREYDLSTSLSLNDFGDLHFVERTPSGSTRPIPMPVDRVSARGRRDLDWNGFNGDANRLYLRGRTLGFYVAPTSAFTVTVHYAPILRSAADLQNVIDDLANLTNVPTVRDEFQDAIVYRTAYFLIMSEEGTYQPIKQEAAEFEARMVNSLRRRVRGPKFLNVLPRRRFSGSLSGITGRR